MTYEAFLDSKAIVSVPTGIPHPPDIHPVLFPFQRDIVRWALKRGRAALFEDCGLGKTVQQCEWAYHVCQHTKGDGLILAPLGVREQTARESELLLGRSITVCDSDSDVRSGTNITNYEKLHKFDPSRFTSIVLDESSILKSYEGKTRNQIIEAFHNTQFKLACTATPAPNDFMELGNHAEFLGVMSRTEMLSMFFVHDGGETQKWRLKGHAEQAFWKWVASWAVNIRKPSDLGYEDGDFILPPLHINEITVSSNCRSAGFLFPMPAHSLDERRHARRGSIAERCAAAVDLISKSSEQFLVWVGLNDEQDEIAEMLGEKCVSIQGSTPEQDRLNMDARWMRGEVQTMITKGLIFGFGKNWQHCRNVIYAGLNDSHELFYQTVRRCWRFGQKYAVNCWIITSNLETAVVANIKRKEKDAKVMADAMIEHMAHISKAEIRGAVVEKSEYKRDIATGKDWTIHLGDCVEVAKDIPSDSIHFSIFSPPFSSLYVYSNSDRDMGNSRDDAEFMNHFSFMVDELYRVTMPGRICAFHCMNLPTSKARDGVIGIRDFRGELIRLFVDKGWIFHSEVCIWKDPVTAMQRTKALGLLHKQLKKDSCMSRMGIPDYLVAMRKPGENPERVTHTSDEFPVKVWQNYASPIWASFGGVDENGFQVCVGKENKDMTQRTYSALRYHQDESSAINPSDTLQRESAREQADERHICPLQIQVIERAINLWSNPGDVVFSPFSGIASEGYVALSKGRKFIGIELKRSYWDQARANLESASHSIQSDLFPL